MSGLDEEIINVRERPLSTDVNNLQALKDRSILESFAALFSNQVYAPGAQPSSTRQGVVLGGLIPLPAGLNVAIAPGVMMLDSATIPAPPGALDSTYRYAAVKTLQSIAAPTPAGDTWYLLEASPNRTVTVTDNRDVLDAGSGNFVPTLVDKIAERQITFTFLAGSATSFPVPSANAVPIAAVFRPGGGGAVTAANIIDLRPLVQPGDRIQASNTAQLVRRDLRTASTPSSENNNISLDVEVMSDAGKLFYRNTTAFDVTAAEFLESGVVLAGGTWYYLYLVPWRNVGPSRVTANVAHRGVLVLTDQAPLARSRRPAAVFNLPAPYANGTSSDAVCVGALRRNAGNTGWGYQRAIGRDVHLADYVNSVQIGRLFSETNAGAGNFVQTINAQTAGQTPVTSNMLVVRHTSSAGGAGSTNYTYTISEPGASVGDEYFRGFISAQSASVFTVQVPDGADVQYASSGGQNGDTLAATVIGFVEVP